MTKSLYKDDKFSVDAMALDQEAYLMLRPLIKKYADLGYSIREIGGLLHGTVSALESEAVLSKK
jgi:hypothetical protein